MLNKYISTKGADEMVEEKEAVTTMEKKQFIEPELTRYKEKLEEVTFVYGSLLTASDDGDSIPTS